MTIKTVITYGLNDSQTEFQIPFEYLSRKFIKVFLIGDRRRELELNRDYRFLNKKTIKTTNAWGQSEGYRLIEIRRVTSATERVVDFNDGSILRASDLNASQVQAMHIAEEARDLAADSLYVDDNGNLDARGRRIVNLGNAKLDKDAVNLEDIKKTYDKIEDLEEATKLSADKAKESATQAKSSELEAKRSEEKAKEHVNTAKGYSDNANIKYDYIVSNIHRSEAAADRSELAQGVSTSKANVATTQALAATKSAEAAANSAKSAAASSKLSAESIATCKANALTATTASQEAVKAKDASKVSEKNAKASETKAQQYAQESTQAQGAAASAQASASIAETKAEDAKAAAVQCLNAQAAIEVAAQVAQNAQVRALASENSALSSKEAASVSERNAKTSETKSAENRSVTVRFAQQAEASANKSELAEGVSTMKSRAAEDAAVAAAKSAEASAKSAEAAAASAKGTATSVQSCTNLADAAAKSAKTAQEAAAKAVGGGIPQANLKQAPDNNPLNVLSQAGLEQYYVKKDGNAGKDITLSIGSSYASSLKFDTTGSSSVNNDYRLGIGGGRQTLYFMKSDVSGGGITRRTLIPFSSSDERDQTLVLQSDLDTTVNTLAPKNNPTFNSTISLIAGSYSRVILKNGNGTDDKSSEWFEIRSSKTNGLYFTDGNASSNKIGLDFSKAEKNNPTVLAFFKEIPSWKQMFESSGGVTSGTVQLKTESKIDFIVFVNNENNAYTVPLFRERKPINLQFASGGNNHIFSVTFSGNTLNFSKTGSTRVVRVMAYGTDL